MRTSTSTTCHCLQDLSSGPASKILIKADLQNQTVSNQIAFSYGLWHHSKNGFTKSGQSNALRTTSCQSNHHILPSQRFYRKTPTETIPGLWSDLTSCMVSYTLPLNNSSADISSTPLSLLISAHVFAPTRNLLSKIVVEIDSATPHQAHGTATHAGVHYKW